MSERPQPYRTAKMPAFNDVANLPPVDDLPHEGFTPADIERFNERASKRDDVLLRLDAPPRIIQGVRWLVGYAKDNVELKDVARLALWLALELLQDPEIRLKEDEE